MVCVVEQGGEDCVVEEVQVEGDIIVMYFVEGFCGVVFGVEERLGC